MDTIRVLLADDHELVRQGLQSVLGLEPDMKVVGEAATGDEAIEKTCELTPDVLLLDLRMPDTSGLGVCRQLARRGIATKVLVLSTFLDDQVLDVLDEPICGYMLKTVPAETIVQGIRSVAQGSAVFDGSVTRRLAESRTRREDELLSAREREVLELMARGLSNKAIAGRLWLGLATVKTHVSHILRKLGAGDRTQAVLEAMRRRLVGSPADEDQLELPL